MRFACCATARSKGSGPRPQTFSSPWPDHRADVQHNDRRWIQRADGCKVKLGSCDEYLVTRDAILRNSLVSVSRRSRFRLRSRWCARFRTQPGIVRLLDLALGAPTSATRGLYLVAPDSRERDVRTRLLRLAFQRVRDLQLRFPPCGELEKHRASAARFGQGLKPIGALARLLV